MGCVAWITVLRSCQSISIRSRSRLSLGRCIFFCWSHSVVDLLIRGHWPRGSHVFSSLDFQCLRSVFNKERNDKNMCCFLCVLLWWDQILWPCYAKKKKCISSGIRLHTSAISVCSTMAELPLSQLQHSHLIISDRKYNRSGKNEKV